MYCCSRICGIGNSGGLALREEFSASEAGGIPNVTERGGERKLASSFYYLCQAASSDCFGKKFVFPLCPPCILRVLRGIVCSFFAFSSLTKAARCLARLHEIVSLRRPQAFTGIDDEPRGHGVSEETGEFFHRGHRGTPRCTEGYGYSHFPSVPSVYPLCPPWNRAFVLCYFLPHRGSSLPRPSL